MRRLISQKFIELTPYDFVCLVTVRLNARKDIFNVVEAIDKKMVACINVYFAYELLDINTKAAFALEEEEPYVCQLVANDCRDGNAIQSLFRSIPRCKYIKHQTLNVLNLYHRLSNTLFRVYNKLVFKRLKLQSPKMITSAKNLFTRMYYWQNVLCISNLGQEIKFLAQIQNDLNRVQRVYRFKSNRINSEQQKIQSFLCGSFRSEVQIYIPPREREILFRMMESSQTVQKDDNEMRDCIIEEDMDIEEDTSTPPLAQEEYLARLVEDLTMKEDEEIQRDIKLNLCDYSDFQTERERSRERR